MNEQMVEYWKQCLILMKDIFTDVVYDTCIKRLEPLYIEENIFVLKIDLDFFKTTIEERHLEKITKAVTTVTGKEYKVKIVSPQDFLDKPVERVDTTSIKEKQKGSNLQPKYIFETFVKGKSNELAYAAALAVAETPGETTYNPLFLYGGVGLGKTHIMHSIGNYIIEQNINSKVLYVSSETFTNELINSIKDRKNQEFRNKFRDIDVLLIDDIQFISSKEGTQEEFFHTFNTLYNANKQIVITSDQPPKDLKTLEDRLRSRFGSGLTVDITLPDFETRTAILERKAEIDSIEISGEVTKFIARSIVSNIRELEGALNRVAALAKLSNTKITYELAERAIKDLVSENEKKILSVDMIVGAVASQFNITTDELKGKKRTQRIAYPRQVAMYLSRKLLDMSLPQIGASFGRDHSTISYGCEKVAYDLETDRAFRIMLMDLENKIRER